MKLDPQSKNLPGLSFGILIEEGLSFLLHYRASLQLLQAKMAAVCLGVPEECLELPHFTLTILNGHLVKCTVSGYTDMKDDSLFPSPLYTAD